MKNWSTYYYTQ